MNRRTENALYGLLTAASIIPIMVGAKHGTCAGVAAAGMLLAAWAAVSAVAAAADRNRRKTR